MNNTKNMTFLYDGREKEIPEVKCWYPRMIVYDPIKAGSIDGTDVIPHDSGIVRAINSKYKLSPKVKGNPLHTLFVGRLSLDTTEKDLKKVSIINHYYHYIIITYFITDRICLDLFKVILRMN